MATQQQLEQALRNAAVKARQGDERAAVAARRFAAELKAMRGSEPAKPAFDTSDSLAGYKATDDMSGGQRFAAGAGKSLRDTGLGITQFLASGGPMGSLARNFMPKESPTLSGLITGEAPGRNPFDVAGRVEDWASDRINETAQADSELLDTGAGLAGNVAGQVAQVVALPQMAPGRIVNAAMQGATFAGSQPVAEGESRLANAAAGAALGVAGDRVAKGGSLLAKRAMDRLSPVVRESIDLARSAGIPLNAAQTSASPAVKAAQAATRYLPFSGSGAASQQQQEAFNRAVSRSFGENAPKVTDDVVRQARARLGEVFDDIYTRNDVALTPDVSRRMVEIGKQAASDMTEPEAQVVRNQLERIFAEAGEEGLMSGQKYQSLRTALQKVEKGQAGNNIGRLVRELRSTLDDAAAESVGPDDAARLRKVRGQWANLRTVEDSLRQVAGAGGDVRPASLWPLIRKGSTREMRELARVGQTVLKEGIGDSGTAQRQMWQGLLTGGTATGVGMAAGIPALAKLVAGGAIAGRALNSNLASKALQQGRPTSALARLLQPAPKALPLAYAPAAAALTPEEIEEQMRRQH